MFENLKWSLLLQYAAVVILLGPTTTVATFDILNKLNGREKWVIETWRDQLKSRFKKCGNTHRGKQITEPYKQIVGQTCGVQFGLSKVGKYPSGMVTGGKNAQLGQIPWQAKLHIHVKKDSTIQTSFCGASIISDRYLLTAAHCVDIADSVDVYIGGTELTGKDQMNYKVPKCNIIVHVEWDPSAIQNGNDIALIITETKMSLTIGSDKKSNVLDPFSCDNNRCAMPICLPRTKDDLTECHQLKGQESAATKGMISGYGRFSDDTAEKKDQLQYSVVDIHPLSLCNYWWGGIVPEQSTCTDGVDESGEVINACNGDSGGPLSVRRKVNTGQDGIWFLFGIASFVSSDGCTIPETPAVYTRVDKYLDWIRKKTKDHIDWGHVPGHTTNPIDHTTCIGKTSTKFKNQTTNTVPYTLRKYENYKQKQVLYPWQAQVRNKSGHFRCDATLITSDIILMVGDCCPMAPQNETRKFPITRSLYARIAIRRYVLLGKMALLPRNEVEKSKENRVLRVFVTDMMRGDADHDARKFQIAHFKRDTAYSGSIRPISLPDSLPLEGKKRNKALLFAKMFGTPDKFGAKSCYMQGSAKSESSPQNNVAISLSSVAPCDEKIEDKLCAKTSQKYMVSKINLEKSNWFKDFGVYCFTAKTKRWTLMGFTEETNLQIIINGTSTAKKRISEEFHIASTASKYNFRKIAKFAMGFRKLVGGSPV